MHESKTSASTRNSSSATNFKVSNNNLPNNRVTSSANNDNNNNSDHCKRGERKPNSDKNSPCTDDAKSAPVMSNLSSYSLIDDDHIDDQETINVGNLIIDLESDLEKEKIENEQANHSNTDNVSKTTLNTSAVNAPSSTSSSSNKAVNNKSNESKSSITKSAQKSNNKHLNSSGGSSTSTSNNDANPADNNGHVPPRTIFKSSADERGELKMKITRETKPGKYEHKVSANQKSLANTSVITSVQANQGSREEDNIVNIDGIQSSNISSTRECGTSTSVGTITEPECLGPCEPGTSVTLEGIVWQETDGGILVVNVTWRGKTYVGALLDCTRHDWAPPRLCDSPASDIDLKTSKVRGGKRFRGNGNSTLDEKNLMQTTGKLRNGKGRRIPNANEPTPSCSKKQRDASSNDNAQSEPGGNQTSSSPGANSEAAITEVASNQQHSISTSNIHIDKAAPNSPSLIDCNEPNCSKKYRNMNGLLYHQAHAHGADNDSSVAHHENCSSSTKDKMDVKNDVDYTNQDNSDDLPGSERLSPDPCPTVDDKYIIDQHNQTVKRYRTPSPQLPSKLNKLTNPTIGLDNTPLDLPDPSALSQARKSDIECRRSSSSNLITANVRGSESEHIVNTGQSGRSSASHHNFSSSSGHHSSSKQSSNHPKTNNPAPPLPATTEEGMKPSGTSTGPPPAPHQANCYFNPAFLANAFNPYGPIPPYFPRSIYDPMTPPTSNAAFLTRFMNNMRVPPPPSDSPSRLLSPSMPKNLPYTPFKSDGPGPVPPSQIPTSIGGHPIPNISPHMSGSQHPPPPPHPTQSLSQGPLPPPPPALGSGSPSLRMPSQGDPMMPPTSQQPFLPPTSLSSMFGIPGLPNPLGPLGGPQMPNLVDDLAKQFPRRFN